jgi:hypothetical protein
VKSYRFARRSFLGGVGAAVGIHTLLRNMEARAAGETTAPKRLLVTHHPVGTCRYAWTPKGSGDSYVSSRILAPFEDAGLRQEMLVVDGLDMQSISGPGGGHEKGTVVMMTGTPTQGTRTGQTETDDPMAAGPSFDQLLLALRADDLGARPFPSLYALCDDRIDFQEISTRCMSYSMSQKERPRVQGGSISENIPIRPTLSPLDLYTRVFGTFMPGGASEENVLELRRARAAKKSVLDFSLGELRRMRTLAPSSQKPLLDAHEDAITQLEVQLDAMASLDPLCGVPSPPGNIKGGVDDGGNHNNYDLKDPANQAAATADQDVHEQVGAAHLAIIRAAFQCDLTRVGLFQWSPGTNHVAFSGLYPGNAGLVMQHHPTSHRITSSAQINVNNADAEFLVAVEIWYNQRLAKFLQTLQVPDINDPSGGTLLDNTIVPYLTEVSETLHGHSPMPLTLFGGRNLGFQGGQYLNFPNRPYNDLWLTIFESFDISVSALKSAQVNGAKGATLLQAPYTGSLPGLRA